MLNSPRLVDYRPYGRLVELLATVEGREKRVKELKKDWDTLVESLGRVGAQGLPAPHGRRAEQDLRMLRLEVTPASEGYKGPAR